MNLDFYRGFDEEFFRKEHREESSLAYKSFLTQHEDIITGAIENPEVGIDDEEFYTHLGKIRWEAAHTDIIKKPGDGLIVTLEDIMTKAEVSLTPAQQSWIGGRIHYHLARLMLPEQYSREIKVFYKITASPKNTVCENFGKNLIKYAAQTPAEVKRVPWERSPAEKFRYVVGSEGHHVFLFWSLAPYIHLNLTERGLSAQESMSKIVDWVVGSYDEGRDYFDQKLLASRHVQNYYDNERNPLGFDERMPSHLKARLLAREVAQELVE